MIKGGGQLPPFTMNVKYKYWKEQLNIMKDIIQQLKIHEGYVRLILHNYLRHHTL